MNRILKTDTFEEMEALKRQFVIEKTSAERFEAELKASEFAKILHNSNPLNPPMAGKE